MKIKYCILLLFLSNIFFHSLKAQPTGEEKEVMLYLNFLNTQRDTLSFQTRNNKIASDNEIYQLDFFVDNIEDSIIFQVKSFASPTYEFRVLYYPASRLLGEETIYAYENVVIFFTKKEKVMYIIVELFVNSENYQGREDIYVIIPFKEGKYKITDLENPELIPIKQDRE